MGNKRIDNLLRKFCVQLFSKCAQHTLHLWNCGIMVVVMLCEPAQGLAAPSLMQLWKEATRGGLYHPPSKDALREADSLFVRTLRQQEGQDELQQAWATLGMELVSLGDKEGELWVIREQSSHKTGRGIYAVRVGKAQSLAIQAPHSGADRYTGEIALRLLQEGKAKAGAWRTVPRSKADLAHLEGTYFQAFTRAFAQVFPTGQIIQLHGFEQEKRVGRSAGDAEIVLSDGTTTPPPRLTQVANCWKRELSVVVKRYPDEAKDLGATNNAQARLLHSLGHSGFLHVEMSEGIRAQLQKDPARRAAWLRCVTDE
jgi:hypothetical protein